MKAAFLPFSGLIILFAACANGKQLQEKPPRAVKQAYYTQTGNQELKVSSSPITFYLELEEDSGLEVDTVYFRGRKAIFEKDASETNLYTAYFEAAGGEKKDFIMHRDPKKEYGNSLPKISEPIPFELDPGEAVVHYRLKDQSKYFKLQDVQQKEDGEVRMKKPKNIRH